ncbi:MAG: hypothetical protein FWH28_00895 [Clostridiales bacterium]|nr:hypothetical protein [Clostridiales bacterium]
MNYPRIPFMAEGTPTERRRAMFTSKEYDVPVLDRPLTPVENFKRAWKHQTPVWAPTAMLDFDTVRITGKNPPLIGGSERVEYTDDWGCQWVYVPVAGGSMLKPGTQLLDDITKWDSRLVFPDWKTYDWKTAADAYLQNRKDPDKVLSIDIGTGCTEKLVAVMGGYEEAMVAMAQEQDAVTAFFDAYADNLLERYDLIKACYPSVNQITYHDDWGTERDTFFSEAYFESMVWAPTKKVIDHIKASGDICFELHTCGKIERFIRYIIDLKVDILQIQRRANDMPGLKRAYGDKVGFCCSIEGLAIDEEVSSEERLAKIRNTVDLYGRQGGLYLVLGAPPSPEAMWDACCEAYCYSREYYDKERGIV